MCADVKDADQLIDRHTRFFTFQSIGNVRCSSGLFLAMTVACCTLDTAGYIDILDIAIFDRCSLLRC